ncbi:MAG: RusA family crossover junction endodeoxyribonuclease [Proteobacteria bacterium]|nr:RusA family crossover junction endodeoxyribonuclease [Pseudomonadota bacterium]
MLSITLPLPPSTNRIWRVARGRVHRSAEYLDWIDLAARALRDAGVTGAKVVGRYALQLFIPAKDRADADNRLKATCDLLVKQGLVPDDRFLEWALVQRSSAVSAGLCRVHVFEVADLHAFAPGEKRPEVALPVQALPGAGRAIDAAPS